MKKKMLPVLILTFAVTAGTLTAFALAAEEADAISGATRKPAITVQSSRKENSSPTKVFTAQELATYDGKNGRKAYIAVSGTVYDVSKLFKNGQHYGCTAGQDLTAAFKEEHGDRRLTTFPVVGTMQGSTTAPGKNEDSLIKLTEQERQRLTALVQQERELEQKEEALEQSYYSGAITRGEYLKQEAALEKTEDSVEMEMDALETKAGVDDHDDYDDYDDHDDHDDHDD